MGWTDLPRLLMDEEYEETYDFNSDVESDSETDMIWTIMHITVIDENSICLS